MNSHAAARAVVALTAVAFVATSVAAPRVASADPATAQTTPAAPPPPAPPPSAARGVAVLATPGAEDAAWALAKEVYASGSLRPPGLDDARARVLAGDPPRAGAPRGVVDLADERAAVHGADAASRAILRTIASQLSVRALVVVDATTPPTARVYVTDTGTFDAARYASDPPDDAVVSSPPVSDAGTPGTPDASSDGGMDASAPPATAPPPAAPPHWSGTVASLDRAYGQFATPPPPPTSAPSLAWSALPPGPPPDQTKSHPFYSSPWFWAAIGAAAFGTTAVYFATRDSSPDSVHLELQVH